MSAKIKKGFDDFANTLSVVAAATAAGGAGEPPGLAHANAELACNVRDLTGKLDKVVPAVDVAHQRLSNAEDSWPGLRAR